MTDALQVKGLRKSYGKKEVLKGIDFACAVEIFSHCSA